MSIGIIGAMQKEIDGLKGQMTGMTATEISGITFYSGELCGKDVVVAAAGIGKVSAAVCTQTMILKYAPEAIVCCGVAGGLSDTLRVCDVAIANAVVQHDMDTSPVGDPVGLISSLGLVEMPCSPAIVTSLQRAAALADVHAETGIIATGDQFICSDMQRCKIKETFRAIAAEMEGGSIGQVCLQNKIPFGIIRSISDGAKDDSHLTYAEFMPIAAHHSVRIMMYFLKEYQKG